MARKNKPPILPLALVVEEYERDLRRHEMQPKTIEGYHKVLKQVMAFLLADLGRAATLDDFTVTVIERFIDHLLDREKPNGNHLSLETMRTYVRTLKAFSSWLAAEKQGYTEENRLLLFPMPRPSHAYKLPLEMSEIQALVNACDVSTALGTRDLALLLTFLDGGLRATELINLTVQQVNLDSGQIFIALGKGRRTRQITIGDETRRILRRYAFFRDALAGAAALSSAPFFQTEHGTIFT